ncbi:MAG: 30S ribosomal protein S16 [Candidatus Bipolaricaulia bacterium]
MKIRLQRVGRKNQPAYRVVVVDERKPRDTRVIDRLGHYNPLPDPPEIEIDTGRTVEWLINGAQPTEAARALLKKFGVMAELHRLRHGG